MLRLPEDVESRLCKCFTRLREPRDVLGIPEVMTVMPGRTVIRKKVDNVESEFGNEETRVHDW